MALSFNPNEASLLCSMIIYGIKNCDTMQKAFKWLDAHKMKYTFHNYREDGLTKEKIEAWLKQVPLNVLMNTRSTTFRELSEADRAAASDPRQAVKLMQANPTMIKRPLIETGTTILTGFKEEEWAKALKSKASR